MNFKAFIDNPRGWEGGKEMLINAAKPLENAGAGVIGIAVNTPRTWSFQRFFPVRKSARG